MSNALEDRGHDLPGALWTARMLLDAPEEIAAVHDAYFAAGARVATTASYQASVPGLVAAGLTREEAEAAILRSVSLAREVRDAWAGDGVQRLVAASVGPYGAYLADGSEYAGRYGRSAAELREFHGPRMELLLSGEPDLLAVETVPDADEAEVLVGLIDELDATGWLSYSVGGDHTRAGQPLEDAFAVAAGSRHLLAVGINCSAPDDVLSAVRVAREVTGLPAVAYPNSGEAWVDKRWVGEAGFEPQQAREWVAAGATYIGGCCRVGPTQIRALGEALSRAN